MSRGPTVEICSGGPKVNDDYIDRAHARSTTIENRYLPCARAWSSQCGIIAIVSAQI